MSTRDRVYKFIVDFMKQHQYAPSVREIADGVQLKSTSSVFSHMEKLKMEGRIDYNPSSPRSIAIPGYKLVNKDRRKRLIKYCFKK